MESSALEWAAAEQNCLLTIAELFRGLCTNFIGASMCKPDIKAGRIVSSVVLYLVFSWP